MLTCVLHLPCTLTGCDTAGAGQHRLIRSSTIARPADVAQSHIMIYHHHTRQGLTLSRTLCFAFDDSPHTVGDRDD